MEWFYWTLGVAGWIGCGALGWAMYLGYLRYDADFPALYPGDRRFAALWALTGPFNLVIGLILWHPRMGLRWW